MKHKTEDIRADQVGQVRITFTNKELTAWGGACSVLAKFLERISFRDWVEEHVPVEEHSPNAKGISIRRCSPCCSPAWLAARDFLI